MKNAFLWRADLKGAYLFGANLKGADLLKANLDGAWLEGAYMWEVSNLTIEQLLKVGTLYEAKLDPELEKQIKEKYPHLLEEPKEEER